MSCNYREVSGYIYVIETDIACKIGFSECPRRRIRQIDTMCPCALGRVFVSCYCPDVMNIERELHQYFQKQQYKNEWYRVDFEIAVTAVKRMTKQHEEYLPLLQKQASAIVSNALASKEMIQLCQA